MAEFQRARSKVWYPSLDDDDEDMHNHHHHHHHLRHHSWRRQPSSSPESRRVSSGSPSNGSHRSQDSGFSDSESGSPLGPSSKPTPTATAAAAAAQAAVICVGRPADDCHATADSFADGLPHGVLPEEEEEEEKAEKTARIPSPCGLLREQRPPSVPVEEAPPHCDCFLPACELSRKFRSYDYASPFRPSPVADAASNRRAEEEPRTPNRTCFIVDELPKSGGPRSVPLQSTPGSVKSFDGHFDQSENVTVVENVKRDDEDNDDDDGDDSDPDVLDDGDSIIDPPVPFVDDRLKTEQEYDATSVCSSVPDRPDTPEHTSTPKSTKDRCCTPRLQYRKELQLKKPKSSQNIIDRTERENEVPVGQWLNELRFRCEPECMTTLQSKSIATSEDAYRMSAIVCTDSGIVRELYQRTKAISDEFKKVYNDLNKCRIDNFGPSVQTLTGLLLDFVCDHERELPEHGQELCMDLVDVSERLRIHANRRLGNRKIILNDVSALGQIFSELVDALLLKKIQSLVNILEEPSTDIELVKAMSSINSLGLESVHLGSLVTKCNGIRSLLTVCIDAVSSTVRSAALRTLAMVCCSSNSVRQFEKAGGVEILSDLLGSKNRSEKELTDAVSVLAQITAPWIEDNHVVNGLNEYLEIFISTLTYLVETTQSSETLLLSSAALANITFIEPKAIRTILHMGTTGSLIEAVRKNGTKSSVFLQEQTATLLANMAAVPETRPHMAANHAVIALLCFLQVRHSPLQRVPEILAAERLQHKTAIALSRLCSDVEVSKQVVELEGVNRLIRLCKDERERNHSDGVLVACLASLRKIAANCGKDIMNQYDAAELIEPRLLDSFLLYSSKQESYV